MSAIDQQVKMILKKYFKNEEKGEKTEMVFYFKGQLTSNYRIEEKRIQKIIKDNVKGKVESCDVHVRVYYKNVKLVDSIKTKMDRFHSNNNVVYQYACPESICNNAHYIGYTTNLLNVRMKQHENNGSIKSHHMKEHKQKPRDLTNNTKVIARFSNANTLQIAEAILIKENAPVLNQHDKGLTRHLNIIS